VVYRVERKKLVLGKKSLSHFDQVGLAVVKDAPKDDLGKVRPRPFASVASYQAL
jgi:hypothetical protein